MSKPNYLILIFLGLIAFGTTIGNGDSPFKGNRRPGILAPPTDQPTGENALLYQRIGRMTPNEYLEFVSEEPKTNSD